MFTIDANIWVAAFDSSDRFHERSVAFLRALAARQCALHGPVFLLLEAGCALARRARVPAAAAVVEQRLRAHPTLALHPLDDRCLSKATELGARRLLRAADALYAAVAELNGAPLVTWDDELVQRAGALTPETCPVSSIGAY